MQVGVIGLGWMGGIIVRCLMKHGHEAVVYDRDAILSSEGAVEAGGLEKLVPMLAKPQAIWLMLSPGKATGGAVRELGAPLDPGDVVIDGGNAFWQVEPKVQRL
jgi:6-phosphogluconate dehydrogenase